MQLRDIASVSPGYHFRGPIVPDPQGEHRVLQVRDLGESGRFDPDALTRVQLDRSAEGYVLRQGDVVYLARGERRVAAPIRTKVPGLVAPNHFFVLRPRSQVHPEYLSWYLTSPEAQASILGLTQGSNVPFIPKRALLTLGVPVPPLEVQEKIVAIQKLADRQRELRRQLEEEYHSLVTTVCLQAVHREGT